VPSDAVASGPDVVTISTATITLPGAFSLDPTFLSYSTTTLSASVTVYAIGPTTTIGAIIDARPGGFTIIDGMPYAEWTSQHPGAFITFTTGPGQGTTLGPGPRDSDGAGGSPDTVTVVTPIFTTVVPDSASSDGLGSISSSMGSAANSVASSIAGSAAAAQMTAFAGPAAVLLLVGLALA
jgi:hypothetical protein